MLGAHLTSAVKASHGYRAASAFSGVGRLESTADKLAVCAKVRRDTAGFHRIFSDHVISVAAGEALGQRYPHMPRDQVLTISFKYIDIGMMDLRINQIGGAGVKVHG